MKGRIVTVAVAVLLTWLWAGPSGAVFLDEDRTMQITGKALVQGSWRMQKSDSNGRTCLLNGGALCENFTFPTTKVGHLIQERNLFDVEFYHNVAGMLGSNFTLLDRLSYRVRVKYFYDSLYDIGPDRYTDTTTAEFLTDRQGLRLASHYDTQHDPLWNAYIDMAKGRFQLRVGRQDLSWGESDGFRLLDMIEPLDGRFGFPLVEDLDDRRIPLWMVRPTIGLGTLGPFSNVSIDAYWVPGTIDNQEAPSTPTGNPFAAPNPPGEAEFSIPNKNLGNSRGGGRLIFSAFNNAATFSIGHYVTFNDYPSARLKVYIDQYGNIRTPFLIDYYQQQITGASATFALPFDPYTIARVEIANFWDERVFNTYESFQLAQIRFAQNNFMAPGVGAAPTKNILRWMIGLDRNVWIRWLNPENTFYCSAQYFHTNIMNYDRDIANAIVDRLTFDPTIMNYSTHFTNRRNDEIQITYLVNTLYYHGNIQPQVFGMYDTRGVNALVPSISYQHGTNWVFTLKYAFIQGVLANLGLFRDRDELLFRVQYNLS